MHTHYWLRSALYQEENGGGAASGAATETGAGGGTLLGGGESAPPAQEQAAFTPSYDGAIGKDGTFTEGWTARAFGAEYHGPLSRVRSLVDMDKVLRENMEAARGKAPEWPGPNATTEQIAAIRRLTGAPERPEEYGQLRPASIPEDMWDPANEAKLQTLAHKYHLPPGALRDIVDFYAETVVAGMKQNEADAQAYRASEMTKLRQEFGRDFDTRMGSARTFARSVGLSLDNPMFLSADSVIAMSRGADRTSEDRLVHGNTNGFASSPRAQASAIMTDPSSPHYKKYQEGDREAVALVAHLLQQGG
jgi:hypothetical protein